MNQEQTESSRVNALHFIISAPRSGSTWLARALNGHPKIFATENRLFGEFCEIWPNSDGSMSPRITFDEFLKQFSTYFMYEEMGLKRRQFIERFQRAFLSFLTNFCLRQSGKELIIDKVTPYLNSTDLVLDRIGQYFPDSRTIQLIRDGRDVVTSGTFDWIMKDSQGTDRFSFFVERRPGHRMKRFFDDNVLERWILLWKEPIAAYRRFEQKLIVRYESMIENQGDVLKEVFAYLDCECDDSIVDECIKRATFERMSGRKAGDDAQPLAKARKGVAGDWKNYFTRRDGDLFQELAGELLIELGYEADPKWVDQLPDELDFVCH